MDYKSFTLTPDEVRLSFLSKWMTFSINLTSVIMKEFMVPNFVSVTTINPLPLTVLCTFYLGPKRNEMIFAVLLHVFVAFVSDIKCL
eukprot:g28455.t1